MAMPGMEDERFAESVILLVGHGEEGAMGLVVNHELADLTFADVIDELDLGDPDAVIRLPDTIRQRAVMRGGPVEKGRGFVLHSGEDNLTLYRFNTEMIDHLFCKTCGIESFARGSDGKGNTMVMINVACLEDAPPIDRATIKHWDGANF